MPVGVHTGCLGDNHERPNLSRVHDRFCHRCVKRVGEDRHEETSGLTACLLSAIEQLARDAKHPSKLPESFAMN